MARPYKNRCIFGQPGSVVYKPAGIPARELEWVILALDEFETIRLLDHLGYDQEKTAEKMEVSRPTVTRIYASARKKIATALVLGQAIKIEGGAVTEIPRSQYLHPGSGFGYGGRQNRHRGGCGRGNRGGWLKNRNIETKE